MSDISGLMYPTIPSKESMVRKIIKEISDFVNLNFSHAGNNDTFDYISVTPPYAEVDYVVLMRLISESPFVGDDTFIVCIIIFLTFLFMV